MNSQGFLYALAAYVLWGLLPIYWKFLDNVDSLQILLHRMVWSLGLLLFLLLISHDWQWLRSALREKKSLLIYLLAAIFLAANWGTYIWAVNAGFVIETSLGYFISPLVSVFVGVVFFQERLRWGQWSAIAVAALGVLVLTIIYGRPPWIALTLASTWNIYAAIKKLAPLTTLRGLTLETAILFPFALGTLLIFQASGSGQFAQLSIPTDVLLVMSGIATATPLIFFTAAAKRLSLTMIGMMQYIAPTIQLSLGIFIYQEYFDATRLLGFCIIWLALFLFTAEGLRNKRKLRLATA